MMKFSNNIFSLEHNRKCELIERCKTVKKMLDDYYFDRKMYNENGLTYKLGKAIIFYKNIYKEDLTLEEKTIIYLYVIFPSDREFIKLLKTYDIKSIANIYQVPENMVKLRFKMLKDILAHNNPKTLKK